MTYHKNTGRDQYRRYNGPPDPTTAFVALCAPAIMFWGTVFFLGWAWAFSGLVVCVALIAAVIAATQG